MNRVQFPFNFPLQTIKMEEHPWKACPFREELLLTQAIDWKRAQNFSWVQEQISPRWCLLEGLSIFPVKVRASHHFNNLAMNLQPFQEDVYPFPYVGVPWIKSPNGPSSSLFYIFYGEAERSLSARCYWRKTSAPYPLDSLLCCSLFWELIEWSPDAPLHPDLTSLAGIADVDFLLESSTFTCLMSQFFRILISDF